MPRWVKHPTSARTSSTGSSLCATASTTTRALWPSPTSTPASAGRCSHARRVTTRTAGSATHLQPPEPPHRINSPTRCDIEIDNEVRPSTVKTWLAIRREPLRVDRSSSRINADHRMRTPCAAYTLARTNIHTRSTRPCREMQSDPPRRSPQQRPPRPRAPPRSDPSFNLIVGLTGNSVEIVRRQPSRRRTVERRCGLKHARS